MDPQKPPTKISIPIFAAPPKQEQKPAAPPNKIRIAFNAPIPSQSQPSQEFESENDNYESGEDEMSQPDSYQEPEPVQTAPIVSAKICIPPPTIEKKPEPKPVFPLKISFNVQTLQPPKQEVKPEPKPLPKQDIQVEKPLSPQAEPAKPVIIAFKQAENLVETTQTLEDLKIEAAPKPPAPVMLSIPMIQIPQKPVEREQKEEPLKETPIEKPSPKKDVVMTEPVEKPASISIQIQQPKTKTISSNVTDFYTIQKRSVSLQFDTVTRTFKGQAIVELTLNQENAQKLIDHYKNQSQPIKLKVEAYLIAKQIEIVNVYQLQKTEDSFKKDKLLQLREGGLEKSEAQAQVQKATFENQPRNLYQIEQIQRQQYKNELINGTSTLKKKLFSIKTKKADISKLQPTISLLIEYICSSVTSVGGIQRVVYTKDREEIINNQDKEAQYFMTTDLPDQSLCWLPQLVGTRRSATDWCLKFVVPKEYMIIASGVQTQRTVDQQGNAFHEYALTGPKETTIPDKIGFVCTLFPYISEVLLKHNKNLYACFVSKSKQINFCAKFVQEVSEYLQGLLHHPLPCEQTQLVFLPNLFPNKAPKQRMSFAGGLHFLDQQLLFKPSQIDKRHHTYKQIAAALTFDYFGSLVREKTFSDTWLLVAICERIGDRFKKRKCGSLLYRYHVYTSIEKLYKQIKNGVEVSPLQRQSSAAQTQDPEELFCLGPNHPAEQTIDDVFYRKCQLLFHMIESNIDEVNLDKILREMFSDAIQSDRELSQIAFRKKFKKICGLQPKSFYYNWIWATGCPKLELSYEFNKRNNSLDLQLKQTSAVRDNLLQKKNLDAKLNKIFGMTPNRQKFELLKDQAYPGLGLDCFYVQMQQACRRWFYGEINIVIYQVEGSGGDILKQQHKMSLKEFKSGVAAHIPLQGRVKRTMQNKKKDIDTFIPDSSKVTSQSILGGSKGSEQFMMTNDVWKFEMNEFELEDFPQETKNIFQGRELDNNPVLWIRIDPDMEYIRKAKVVQQKRNNWLFQLLRENDIIGQIEAVKQLHKFNEELVYEILKTVARNDNYFFKVRKHVFRALQKMEVCAFQKYLSHEMFLLKFYNSRNFDETTGFYKENNFGPLLEYYLDQSVISAIAKCKEKKLELEERKQEDLDKLRQKRDEALRGGNHEDAISDNQSNKEVAQVNTTGTAIRLPFSEEQLTSAFSMMSSKKLKEQKLVDENLYKTTTKRVAEMLMKVLEQNDNSSNPVDDSFFLKNLLQNLGKMDNLQLMPQIAAEIHRQFKLDQISNASPHFAITIGAIKGFYNMRKQIFIFVNKKAPNLEESSEIAQIYKVQIAKTEEHLNLMYAEIMSLLINHAQHLRIRLFIFEQEMKHAFYFSKLPFVKALLTVLGAIKSQNQKMQVRFATLCLRELAMFLEKEEFVGKKLDLSEVLMDNPLSVEVNNLLWEFVCQPHVYLQIEFIFWVKRVYRRLYGAMLPEFLRKQQPQNASLTFDADQNWIKSESQLQAEDALRQQAAADNLEAQKQLNLISKRAEPEPAQTKIRLEAFDKARKIIGEKPAPESSSGAIKIQLGNFSVKVPTTYNNDQSREESWDDDGDANMNEGSDFRNVSMSQDDDDVQEDESEHDPFADRVTEDETLHNCWKILGKLFYHFESADFCEPISEERFGPELFEDYMETIKEPMDFKTMQEKFYRRAYRDKIQFYNDIMLIFTNCREYNVEGSEIYTSSITLENYFHQLWREYGLYK